MAKATRVEINRARYTELTLGFADAVLALADAIIAATVPPDAPPIGKGLIRRGGTAVWVGLKKVGGVGSKPRSLKLVADWITAIAGYGWPGRFAEIGTIHEPARPFLTPAAAEVLPDAEVHLRGGLARVLK